MPGQMRGSTVSRNLLTAHFLDLGDQYVDTAGQLLLALGVELVARCNSVCGPLLRLREALFDLENFIVGVAKTVCDHQRCHQQDSPFGHLPELAQDLPRLGVEQRVETSQGLLLFGAVRWALNGSLQVGGLEGLTLVGDGTFLSVDDEFADLLVQGSIELAGYVALLHCTLGAGLGDDQILLGGHRFPPVAGRDLAVGRLCVGPEFLWLAGDRRTHISA